MMALLLLLAAAGAEPATLSPMETAILKLFGEIPYVAALIVVIWIFLKFLVSERVVTQNFLSVLNQSHLDARKESQARIGENSQCLRDNIEATAKNTAMLADLARYIERLKDKG
jgi:hypothetical protein